MKKKTNKKIKSKIKTNLIGEILFVHSDFRLVHNI